MDKKLMQIGEKHAHLTFLEDAGGGGAKNSASVARNGGAGGNGWVRVIEYS